MENQTFYAIIIPRDIKSNECFFGLHCIKMFTFLKHAVWIANLSFIEKNIKLTEST